MLHKGFANKQVLGNHPVLSPMSQYWPKCEPFSHNFCTQQETKRINIELYKTRIKGSLVGWMDDKSLCLAEHGKGKIRWKLFGSCFSQCWLNVRGRMAGKEWMKEGRGYFFLLLASRVSMRKEGSLALAVDLHNSQDKRAEREKDWRTDTKVTQNYNNIITHLLLYESIEVLERSSYAAAESRARRRATVSSSLCWETKCLPILDVDGAHRSVLTTYYIYTVLNRKMEIEEGCCDWCHWLIPMHIANERKREKARQGR